MYKRESIKIINRYNQYGADRISGKNSNEIVHELQHSNRMNYLEV